ncbi:MAG: hypothetical protein JXR36_16490 [Bacteroidales bacterium]|nr:hypothetical protein [Bacteroidales bacterium]
MKINKFLIVFVIFIASCDISIQKNTLNEQKKQVINYNNINKTIFDNIAIVTIDSCEKWMLPITSFSIEYPNDLSLKYYNTEKGYLELVKLSNNIVIEQIGITYSNSNIRRKAYYSLLNSNLELEKKFGDDYATINLKYTNINNKKYILLTSILQTKNLKSNKYSGEYVVFSLIKISPVESLTGLKISFTRSLEQNEILELNKYETEILNTLNFIY